VTNVSRYFQEFRGAAALEALVNIDAAVDEHILATKSGDLILFLSLRGVDPECLDAEEIEAVTRVFASALRTFDERFRIHQYLLKAEHPGIPAEQYANPVVQEATQARLQHLAGRSGGLYRIEGCLAVVYEGWHPATRRKSRAHADGFWASARRKFSLKETQSDYGAALDAARELLHHKCAQFAGQLRGTIEIDVLNCDQAFRILRRLLNYSPGVYEPVQLQSNQFVGFQACSSHLECHRDYLKLGEHYVTVLTLKEAPAQTFAQMLRALVDLPGQYILTSEWRREETDKIRTLIRSKRRHFHQSKTSLTSQFSETGGAAPKDALVNTGAAAMVGDLGECLEAIEVRGTQLGEFSLTLVLYDTDPEALRRSAAQGFKIFANHDAHLVEERYNRLNTWLSTIPGNSMFNLRRMWLTDQNYGDLSFLFAPDQGEMRNQHLDAEYLAVLETGSGVPYFLNLHAQDVAHAYLLGGTGAGKSFCVNFLLTHLQKYDPFTAIFDLGGSYESLTTLFSGSYLSLASEKRRFTINPFCLPPSAENLRFLLAWVRVLAESGGYRVSAEEEQDLYEQIENLYQIAPAERRLSTLANIVRRDLRRELSRWTQAGPYGDLFDHAQDTLTFSNFQTFDFEGMSEMKEQMEALLFYVLHRASTAINDIPGRFKVVVMDEAWRFFSHPGIKAYMVEALKTWRKKNAALILATQSGDDLRRSDLLPVIVENCPTQIFLANRRMDKDAYQKAFHLNRTEVDLIAGLVPKQQLLIKRPDRSKVVTLSVHPKEYWIYTSHPQERERRREIFARYGFREGLDMLVKEESL
jgi:type IV secretion/conjugal transfer VirB4 family ATPase